MSHPKTVLPLGAFLSACLLAAVHAQTPACDTLAVASDPATSDSLYPPTLADVQIPSSGARMNGILYLAQGKGPHATVLFLYGFPGSKKALKDLIPLLAEHRPGTGRPASRVQRPGVPLSRRLGQ